MKSSGVSSARNLVREAKAARTQQEKQETCLSFRRGLRYFEPRIAHVGISLFMCHDVRRRVYGTDQSPVFFSSPPTWQFLATSVSAHPNSHLLKRRLLLQVDREVLVDL